MPNENDLQLDLYCPSLTTEALITEALEFTKQPLEVGEITGPAFGDVIEAAFKNHLWKYNLPSTGKKGADFASLNVDLKTIQLRGKRGGAAKIHGYSKGGPPDYALLILGYEYNGHAAHFTGVFFIPADAITWVQAEHYLFSLSDRKLLSYRIVD